MEKYLVSELRNMCKEKGLKLSLKGKPLKKSELIQNLLNIQPKVTFSNEENWKILEFNKEDETHYTSDELEKMIINNRYRYQIEQKLKMNIGDFNEVFNHEYIKLVLDKFRELYTLHKENIKMVDSDRIILYSVYEVLKKKLGHLTSWFINNHRDLILRQIKV